MISEAGTIRMPRTGDRGAARAGGATRVLVAYASRHGSTTGIAERIAAALTDAGLTVDIRPVSQVDDLEPYDAFVIGGAAYMTHWLRDATTFVKRHREPLAARPLWLFSSGPLGTDTGEEDARASIRPQEFDELTLIVHPRGERVFFGAWDPDAPPVGMIERMIKLAPGSARSLPAGDFRDWADIDGWAAQIARRLGVPAAR